MFIAIMIIKTYFVNMKVNLTMNITKKIIESLRKRHEDLISYRNQISWNFFKAKLWKPMILILRFPMAASQVAHDL